jgi:hypothetical protein
MRERGLFAKKNMGGGGDWRALFCKKKHGRWRDLVIAKFNSKLIRKKKGNKSSRPVRLAGG